MAEQKPPGAPLHTSRGLPCGADGIAWFIPRSRDIAVGIDDDTVGIDDDTSLGMDDGRCDRDCEEYVAADRLNGGVTGGKLPTGDAGRGNVDNICGNGAVFIDDRFLLELSAVGGLGGSI